MAGEIGLSLRDAFAAFTDASLLDSLRQRQRAYEAVANREATRGRGPYSRRRISSVFCEDTMARPCREESEKAERAVRDACAGLMRKGTSYVFLTAAQIAQEVKIAETAAMENFCDKIFRGELTHMGRVDDFAHRTVTAAHCFGPDLRHRIRWRWADDITEIGTRKIIDCRIMRHEQLPHTGAGLRVEDNLERKILVLVARMDPDLKKEILAEKRGAKAAAVKWLCAQEALAGCNPNSIETTFYRVLKIPGWER